MRRQENFVDPNSYHQGPGYRSMPAQVWTFLFNQRRAKGCIGLSPSVRVGP